MTNLWPINMHTYISLDRARFMYALVKSHYVDLYSIIIHIIHAATQEKSILFPLETSLLDQHPISKSLLVLLSHTFLLLVRFTNPPYLSPWLMFLPRQHDFFFFYPTCPFSSYDPTTPSNTARFSSSTPVVPDASSMVQLIQRFDQLSQQLIEQRQHFDKQITAVKQTVKEEIEALERRIGTMMKTTIAHFNGQLKAMATFVQRVRFLVLSYFNNQTHEL